MLPQTNGDQAVVDWAPRSTNYEADELANGNTGRFDPAKRIVFKASEVWWDVLPEALQKGREMESECQRALAEGCVRPDRTRKQRKRKLEDKLRFMDRVVIPVERNAPSSCQQTRQQAAGQVEISGVSVRPSQFCGTLPFSTGNPGVRLPQEVVCMQGIHKDRCSVRRPYAVHSFVSAFFFGCLFSCVVPGSFAVLSRFSSFPQILGLSESRRQSPRLAQPGWKPSHLGLSEGARSRHSGLTLDGNFSISFLALPLRVSLVRNCFVPPPSLGHPSSWTTWFTLRAPLLLQGPWGGCPGAHRVSSGLL